MEELCRAHNSAADKIQKLEEEQTILRQKIADFEDRSRQNNVSFRGIVDSVTTEKLPAYLKTLCKTLVPQLEVSECLCIAYLDRSALQMTLQGTPSLRTIFLIKGFAPSSHNVRG
ncbi:Hypothetical predicted protein [Pelobates cultripes]|uniref:Uncharacterized protein n=1 Tax=Pelobates cultripes TaxID=61616 RepID=A0AAD1QX79_PELCU|nr:Hypothetical predicted protein [Pelobates cultripes]